MFSLGPEYALLGVGHCLPGEVGRGPIGQRTLTKTLSALLTVRPGKYDREHQVLIKGAELRELKELDLAESFGLDRTKETAVGIVSLGSGGLVGRIVVSFG